MSVVNVSICGNELSYATSESFPLVILWDVKHSCGAGPPFPLSADVKKMIVPQSVMGGNTYELRTLPTMTPISESFVSQGPAAPVFFPPPPPPMDFVREILALKERVAKLESRM
jgi:hypothetical protein